MELDDIVQRISISGQDDIIAALGEIGTAGEEAFKRLGAALGVGGEIFAGLIAGITGVGAALGILAESGAASAHALENLSVQSGASVEDISAMGGALASVGAETEGLSFAFRRMGLAITSTWDQIQKDVRDRSDLIIGDTLKIKETALSFQQAQFESDHFGQKQAGAELASENAKLNVWSAQLALRKELARQGKGDAPSQAEENQLKLAAAFEQVKQAKQAQIEADLRLEQLAREREQAELKVAQAALAAREAQKKAIEDQRNDISTLVTEVGKVADGFKTLEEARGKANLNIENIMKGIIGSTGPAAEAIQNFSGNLIQLATSSPKVLDVMKRTADFLKNSGDAAANAAVGMREFGRGSGTLVVALQQLGSAGLDELIQKFKDLGFATSDNDIKIAREFTKTLETLRFELTALKDQISTAFQPVIGEGLAKFQTFIENNRKAIVDFAATVAEQARPVIIDFFSIISGEKATQTTWVQPLADGLKKVALFAIEAGKAVGAILIGLTGGDVSAVSDKALQGWIKFGQGARAVVDNVIKAFGILANAVDGVVKTVSGLASKEITSPEIILGGLAAWKLAGATIGKTLAVGILAAIGVDIAKESGEAFGGAFGKAAIAAIALAFTQNPVGRFILGAYALKEAAEGVANLVTYDRDKAGTASENLTTLKSGVEEKHNKGELTDAQYDDAKRKIEELRTQAKDALSFDKFFLGASNEPLKKLNAAIKSAAEQFKVPLDGDKKALEENTKAQERANEQKDGVGENAGERTKPKPRDRSKPVDDSVAPGEGERRVDIVRDNKTFHYNIRKEGFETPEEIEQRGTSLPAHKQEEDEIRVIKDNKATYQKIQREKKSETQTPAAGESGAGGGGASTSVKGETNAGDQIAAAADKQIAALNANTEALKLKATEKSPLESVNKPTVDLTSQTGRAIPSAPERPVPARGQNLIDDFAARWAGKPADAVTNSSEGEGPPPTASAPQTRATPPAGGRAPLLAAPAVLEIASAVRQLVLPFTAGSTLQPEGSAGAGKTADAAVTVDAAAKKEGRVKTPEGQGTRPEEDLPEPTIPILELIFAALLLVGVKIDALVGALTRAGTRQQSEPDDDGLRAPPIGSEVASAVAGQLPLPFGSPASAGRSAQAGATAIPPPNAPASPSEATSTTTQSSSTESTLQQVFASVTEKASEFGSKLVESVRSAETILNNLTQSAGVSQKGAVGVPQAAEGNVTSASSQVEKAAGQMFDAIVAKAESTMSQLRTILSQPSQIQTGAASGSQSSPEGHAIGGLVNPVAGVSTVQVSTGMASGGLIRSTSSVQNMHIAQGEPAITFAAGGVITGAGGPKDDRVPIQASPGEYVVQAHAVQAYGVPFMHAINNETAPKSEKHAEGGMIESSAHDTSSASTAHEHTINKPVAYATGGIVAPAANISSSSAQIDNGMSQGGIVMPSIHSESNSAHSTHIANRMADGGPVQPSLMQSSHSEIAIGRDGHSMGPVGGFAEGGHIAGIVRGAGGPKDDRINAKLSAGEYVVNADATKHYGVNVMNAINTKHFAEGGMESLVQHFLGGGIVDGDKSNFHTTTASHAASHTANVLQHFFTGGMAVQTFANGGPVNHYAEGGDVQDKELPSGAQHFAGSVAHTVLGDSSVMQAIQNFTSGSVFGRMADTALPSESRLAFQGPAQSEQMERLGTVDMRTNFGDFQAQMSRNQVRDISDKSTQAKLSRGGRRQSWYQGP